MSLRSDIMQEADTYKYAFLVAHTASILRKTVETPIGTEELTKLKRAQDFMQKVISGTEILTGKQGRAFAAYEAIRALSFVFNPIEALQSFVNQERDKLNNQTDPVYAFKRIENYLGQAIQGSKITVDGDQALASEFFEWLSQSLLQSVNKSPMEKLVIDQVQKAI